MGGFEHSEVHSTCNLSTTTLLDTTLPLSFELLVVVLATTALLALDFAVLAPETTGLLFTGKYLFNKVAFPVLLLDPASEVFGGAFDDSANLTVLGSLHLAAIFLVVAMRVEDITHFQELQVALELGCEVGFWKVVPGCAGGGFLLLRSLSAAASQPASFHADWCG